MAKISDVYDYLSAFAPVEMKMDFDNVGHLVGRADSEAAKIIVSLDVTDDVISEAIGTGARLIVAHHPMFFSLKNVTDADVTGRKIIRMLENGISAICMHTNLDATRGGVNDALAEIVGISSPGKLEAGLLAEDGHLKSGEAFSYGRCGYLAAPCKLADYLEMLKKRLNTAGLRYLDAGRDVYKVGIVGGSGGSEFHHAVQQRCDTFVTADIKYDTFLEAKELGINLIDGDHFCTENVVTAVLENKLRAAFPDTEVTISHCHGQTAKFY